MNKLNKLFKVLQFEEGYSAKPYLCSMNYVTIAMGTKLHNTPGMNPEDFPITVNRNIAQQWMEEEVAIKEQRLFASSVGNIYMNLNEDRKVVLLSMAYQLGVNGLIGFNNMWNSLSVYHYSDAAVHAMDSKWYRQTKHRATRHALVIERGVLTPKDFGE